MVEKTISLKWVNLSAAILHFLLAIIFIGYYANLNRTYNPSSPARGIELSMRDHGLQFSIQKTNCLPSQDFCDASGNEIKAEWKSFKTSEVDIRWVQGLLISFFLITGSFHLFYFMSEYRSGDDGYYQTSIKNANNYFRWMEYSITSTLMLYAIALVSGVKDTNIYTMLAFNNIAMIYMGQLVEEKLKDKENPYIWIIPMFISWALLIAEWKVIIDNFRSRINQVTSFINNTDSSLTNGITIPSWIQYTVFILAFFFICFGFISLVGAIWGVNYAYIEYAYIIASFVAKATLGIFMAYGLGQRQSASNQMPKVI